MLRFGVPGEKIIFPACCRFSRRLLTAWRKDLLHILAVEHGSYALATKFSSKNDGYEWWLSCIYGSSTNDGKEDFWLELNDLKNLVDRFWCMGGDFDEAVNISDRSGRRRANHHMATLMIGL